MLKIVKEVTEWRVPYRQPNHVYLMSGDRVLAVSKWGKEPPQYLKTQSRMDRRGRRFIEEKKNLWGFDMQVQVLADDKPQAQTWEVPGSKGNTYTVSLQAGRYDCTCPGATFRGHCRHIELIRKES